MTRLGIKSSALATIMCVVAMASGYVGALIVAGYILFVEQDKMLRNTALRALAVLCLASLGVTAINMLPNVIDWISDFVGIFGGGIYLGKFNLICSWIASTVRIAETVVLALMAIFAFKGKEFKIAPIDKFLGKVENDD